MLKTLSRIQAEVGEWSITNFGPQQSKIIDFGPLRSLAPLLGIIEEIGEYEKAEIEGDELEMFDAIGDILIYACDFACREQAKLILCDGEPLITETLSIIGGNLCHCVIKHHQGIRGFNNVNKYKASRDNTLHSLMKALSDICRNILNVSLLDVLNDTWEKVSQRDWKKDPEGGNARDAGE